MASESSDEDEVPMLVAADPPAAGALVDPPIAGKIPVTIITGFLGELL